MCVKAYIIIFAVLNVKRGFILYNILSKLLEITLITFFATCGLVNIPNFFTQHIACEI